MKLKEKVLEQLLKANKPVTVQWLATELSADSEVRDFYAKNSDQELNAYLKLAIGSSARKWSGFVYEKINGVYHLDHGTTPVEEAVKIIATIPKNDDQVETIRFPYDGQIVTATVVKRRGAFIDVMLENGYLRSISSKSVIPNV